MGFGEGNREAMDRMETLISELNVDRVMDHVMWLTENTPSRLSGQGEDRKAAQYVVEKMVSYGLATQLLEFETYNSRPGFSELKILKPISLSIASLACGHILSTLPEGMELELAYVGAGGEEEYKEKDVRGKAVLVEVSYSPPTPEKARLAAARGARAIICSNWGEDQDVICHRALKAVWGTPTLHTFDQIPKIAGLSISRKAGELLKKLCSEGASVRIFVRAEAVNNWETLVQPLGILRGTGEGKYFLLVSGHLDAWRPGVTCNATGNGLMLELARVFAKHRHTFSHDIYFVFWNGHEIAEAAGSTWFVDHYWDLLRDHCIGYVNIDSPGLKGATRYEAVASLELVRFVQSVLRGVLKEEPVVSGLRKIGDQSFLGIGIPSISGRMAFSPEEIRRNHGATLGWWNHTAEDTFDKVDPANLQIDLVADATIIWRLAQSRILPYDFSRVAEEIRENLLSYASDVGGNPFQLKPLVEAATSLCRKIEALEALRETIEGSGRSSEAVSVFNHGLRKLSQTLTSPFRTSCSPYEQDSYGLTILSKPIPLLAPMIDLKKMDPHHQNYHLLAATLVKNRNRISDAIHQAHEELDRVIASLSGIGLDSPGWQDL